MYEPELPDMHDAAWRRADVEARDKLKMAADESPWMDLKPSLYGVPKHERYPKLLDVSYKDFLKKEAKGTLRRSAGQMGDRCGMLTSHKVPTEGIGA